MPRSKRLTELITLNETQLSGGAGGARAGPDPCTQLPGDTKACNGHAWACCPSPTRSGWGPPRIPGEPVWPAHETGHFQFSRARQAIEDGRSLRPPLPPSPILLVGRLRPRQTGHAPRSPRDSSRLGAGPRLSLWPVVYSWRPRAWSSWSWKLPPEASAVQNQLFGPPGVD